MTSKPTAALPGSDPLYARARDVIRKRIADGTYTGQLPRAHDLSAEFGVSFGTIQNAVQALQDEGLVLTRRSSGTFITGDLPPSLAAILQPPAAGPPTPPLHSTKEAAAILRVHRTTIHRLIHRGQLEALRIAGEFSIPDAALRQYLAVHHTSVPQDI